MTEKKEDTLSIRDVLKRRKDRKRVFHNVDVGGTEIIESTEKKIYFTQTRRG